jgi:hypothetical protein
MTVFAGPAPTTSMPLEMSRSPAAAVGALRPVAAGSTSLPPGIVSWYVPAGRVMRPPPDAPASMIAARSVQRSSCVDAQRPSPGVASGASVVSSTV